MTTAWSVGILVVVGGWVAFTFNSFVRRRNKVHEAFSGIDVQLRRRHVLVPNLVRVVEGYAGHERQTLEQVARARGAASEASRVGDRARTENGLSRSLDRLLVLVEAYPDLEADASFRRLHQDLVELEETIQYARRYYNGSVREFNNRIQQFPANLLAPMFGMRQAEFFEIESAAERQALSVASKRS